MENRELKPCPFCGNRAFDNIKYSTRKRKQRHFVKCTKCNAYMEYCNKKRQLTLGTGGQTMENLNAEQIKKALECCTRGRKNKDDRPCDDCPYNECNLVGGTSERQIKGTCQGWLMKDALALIKSQEQEIETLHASCTEFEQKCASVKADTVRKMREEVKARCRYLFSGVDVCIIVDQIANEILTEDSK